VTVSIREQQAWAGAIIANALMALAMIGPSASPPPPEQAMTYVNLPNEAQLQDTSDTSQQTPCEQSYIGVGFMYSANTSEIIQAPEPLPAYQAGLRVGDIVELLPPMPMYVGKSVMFRVRRGSAHLTFTINPQHICYLEGTHQ
jgi:hypothetical protein